MVSEIDDKYLIHLMRLRLLVARAGEMDNGRWWSTNGLLGQLGTVALKRGFPKSHQFAQARAVFSVAARRCLEVFDPPEAVTLWKLPAEVEDRFDSMWSSWTEQSDDWIPFFEKLKAPRDIDLLGTMRELALIEETEIGEAKKLKRTADHRAVLLPGLRKLSRGTLTLLAAGFFRSERGNPTIPYVAIECK